MMADDAARTAGKLKGIIDQNGPSYLATNPYEVYLELVESGTSDRKTSGAIFHSLVNGILNDIGADADLAALSRAIQEKCSFDDKMADHLAEIYYLLFSPANEKDWARMHLEGLNQFLDQDFALAWKGFAVWDEGNGTVNCHYEARFVLQPAEAALDEELSRLLDENPFLDISAIRKHFEKKLSGYLDDVFENYCTCEDYYQPVVEDFEIGIWLEDWCEGHGFTVVSCEGEGRDDGYEPKPRFNWR